MSFRCLHGAHREAERAGAASLHRGLKFWAWKPSAGRVVVDPLAAPARSSPRVEPLAFVGRERHFLVLTN
jgi:hypothetical protein